MNTLNRFKGILLEADMFSSSSFISYNHENQYKTMTGAVVSLIIIIAISIGFSTEIISTMQKTTIQSTLQIKKFSNPPEIKLVPLENNFMFGLSISPFHGSQYLDLVNGPQIFDMVGFNLEMQSGKVVGHAAFSIGPCSLQHWRMIPSLIEDYKSLSMDKWLCPSLDTKFSLKGFSKSQYFNSISISLRPCVNTTSNGNKCASSEVINQALQKNTNYKFQISFINPVINPNQPQHTQYFLEDRNYAFASRSMGLQMYLQFSEYQINTDQSIFPYKDINNQRGYIVEQKAVFSHYSLEGNETSIGLIRITRSPTQLIYTRNVLKISQVLSYIGGLISAITIALLLLKSYTSFSFQMSIGFDLFTQPPEDKIMKSQNKSKDNEQNQIKRQKDKVSFHFINFCIFYFYKFLKFFKKGQKFAMSQKMEKYHDQIIQQLDVMTLLKRIIKLQSCMSHIFDQNDLQGIRNSEDITYEKARCLRNLLHKPNQKDEGYLKSIKKSIGNLSQNLCDEIHSDCQNQNNQNSGLALNRIQSLALANEKSDFQNGQKPEEAVRRHQPLTSIKILKEQSRSNMIKKKIYQQIHPNIKKTVQQLIIEDIPSANAINRLIK